MRRFTHPVNLLLAAGFACGLGATSLHAQTDYSYRGALSRLTIGAGASFGFVLPVGTLDTALDNRIIEETAPGLGLRFGLNASYPLSRTIRVHLGSGLDMRNVGKKLKEGNGEGTELDARSYNMQYFYIEPGFSYSAFKLSLNIGMPMSATMPGLDPADTQPADASVDVEGEELEMMLEPRLGATLVLHDDEMGWLGLLLDLGFPLNTFYKESSPLFKEGDIQGTNGLNVMLGLTYQFSIPGTGGAK